MSSSVLSTLLKLAIASSVPFATVSLSDDGGSPGTVAAVSDAPIIEVEDPTSQVPISVDGTFYATPSVNGRSVRMMVDSGANMTVVSRRDAEALGLALPRRAVARQLRTAGGRVPIAVVTVKRLTLAGREIHNLRVAIALDRQVPSLLGHDVLSKFRRITIADDILQFEA